MFTGIVRARGRVAEQAGGRLAVESPELAPSLEVGGSIAVNGVCLTVTATHAGVFRADMVAETLRRTNLGSLRAGDEVNLEPPLTLAQGLDGHLVLGHVDATARVVAAGPDLRVELPPDLRPYVAEKGSIAIDGISLTVSVVDDEAGTFQVALIPHTLKATIAGMYSPGTLVNLEVDVMARYVGRVLECR
jgi:riboflavin synthase